MNEKENKGPIFPGILMAIAGVFLIISVFMRLEGEMEGMHYIKIIAGVLMSAYGVYRIKNR